MFKNNLKIAVALLIIVASANYANAATTKKNSTIKSLFPVTKTQTPEVNRCVQESRAKLIVESLIKKGVVSEEKKDQAIEIVKDCRKSPQKQNKPSNVKSSTPKLLKVTPSVPAI